MEVSINFNDLVAKPLTEETKEAWFAGVMNHLISEDLWNVTSRSARPQRCRVEDYARWRRKNAAALHVMRISCGPHNLPFIRDASEAKVAWDILCCAYHSQPPPQEIVKRSEGIKMGILYKAISDNDWYTAKAFIGHYPIVLDAEFCASRGGTPLHVAAKFGHVGIAEELVRLVAPEYLEIYDASGNTPLTIAAGHSGVIPIAQCLIDKNSHALEIPIRDDEWLIPVQVAFHACLTEMGRYLYSVTPSQVFTENPVFGIRFLRTCIVTGELDIALNLLQRCKQLLFAVDDLRNFATIDMIALHLPDSRDKSQLPFWKRWVYDYIKIPSTTTAGRYQDGENNEAHQDVQQDGEENEAHLDIEVSSTISSVHSCADVQQDGEINEACQDIAIPSSTTSEHSYADVQHDGEINEAHQDVQQEGEINEAYQDIEIPSKTTSEHSYADVQQDGEINEAHQDVQQDGENDEAHEDVQQDGENDEAHQGRGLLQRLFSSIKNLSVMKEIFKMKQQHAQAAEILNLVCENVMFLNEEKRAKTAYALITAARAENVEFLLRVTKANPELVSLVTFQQCHDHVYFDSSRGCHIETSGRFVADTAPRVKRYGHVFFEAVRRRSAVIFNLLRGFRFKHVVATTMSDFDTDMLRVAGLLAPASYLNQISCAALQMQRELQWFKAAESMVDPAYRNLLINGRLKAFDFFKENHIALRKEGERWMKDTATSCLVVGALIVTIMFAVAFTVPGGNHQELGYPIFLENKSFKVFVIADALSLFSSTTSVLTFLGILTSRFAEEDFLYSLPGKLILGLSTLFLSIATMMVAFSATIVIMLQHNSSILRGILPIAMLGGVPVTLFVLLQFPLLIEVICSTYGPGIFKKKVKKWP